MQEKEGEEKRRRRRRKKKSAENGDGETTPTRDSRATAKSTAKYAVTSHEMFCMHQATAALAKLEGATLPGQRG